MHALMQELDERAAFRARSGLAMAHYRRAAKVNQKVIADRLGINVGTIGRWEKGDGGPDAWEVSVMVELYGVPCEWLLDPPADVNVLRRRTEQLRRAAQAAAQADAEVSPAQPGDGGSAPPRRTGRA